MRTPFIAGNWKMHKTVAEGVMELAVCPPATAVAAVADVLKGSNIGVGTQNMHWEDQGAYTGEISPLMVKELAQYVIIGHSERRQYFGETDETVNRKLKAALHHGLTPIVCVGESLEQNEAGKTVPFVGSQIRGAFAGISAEEARRVVLAYEPLYDEETAQAIRVQYGGSVKPHNMAAFIVMAEIDGALVGGASLQAEAFTAIVRNALAAL